MRDQCRRQQKDAEEIARHSTIMNRRNLLQGICVGLGPTPLFADSRASLPLTEFEPRSMLHVHETHVERARYPVIDFHTHVSWGDNMAGKESVGFPAPVSELLAVMDRRNIRTLVDLTGGYGKGLEKWIATLQKPHPDRFIVFTDPWWSKTPEPGYPQFHADQMSRAHALGAGGI